METGLKHNYHWFQTYDSNFSLAWFIKEFKPHLLGNYVCISAFDSGPLHLSDAERQQGWESAHGNAISPLVTADTYLPTAEFDEWYVFAEKPVPFKLKDVYVNYAEMRLSEATDLVNRFWGQLESVKPITYVSEGTGLMIVTHDEGLKQGLEKHWR